MFGYIHVNIGCGTIKFETKINSLGKINSTQEYLNMSKGAVQIDSIITKFNLITWVELEYDIVLSLLIAPSCLIFNFALTSSTVPGMSHHPF